MEILLTDKAAEELEVDLLAVGVRPDAAYGRPGERLDELTHGAIRRELDARGFDARAGAQVSLPTYGAIRPRNLLLYGLGRGESADEGFRLLAAAAIADARAIHGHIAAIALDDGPVAGTTLTALAEGAELAAYLRNVGTSGNAGTIICGLFLKEFVSCQSWAHLDLSGVSFCKQASPLGPSGAVGFGVRTILRYLIAG